MYSFLELARSRRSLRRYSPRKIERKDLELCAEAARHAPSACNSQPWKFILIDDPAQREKIAGTFQRGTFSMNAFVRDAAAFVAIVSEKQKFVPWLGGKIACRDLRQIDLGLACSHLVLQAQELGIGSCILGWFNQKQLRSILSLPPQKRIELVVSLGYPADDLAPREKRLKEKNDVISFNRY